MVSRKILLQVTKSELQKYIEEGLTQRQIADKLGRKSLTYLNEKVREYGLKFGGASRFNRGEGNATKRKDVRERISKAVKSRWDEGVYEKRINGMVGMRGALSPLFKPENHTPLFLAKNQYKEFLSQYEDITVCRRCGSGKKINVHHIDEDSSNFLPSNLEPLCVGCHGHFHYSLQKQPFITIGKIFSFAAAHRLPDYEGSCSDLHGHEWSLVVSIKKRVDKKTGMVLDFSVLKNVVNEYVISSLDHSYLNDYIDNPTAENILIRVWEVLMFDAHLKGIERIDLWETPTSEASLTKEGMLSVLSDNIESFATWRAEE